MTKQLAISYLYMAPLTQARFEGAIEMGWQRKALVQQCVHAYCKKYRNYYGLAAQTDCKARGMTPEGYYQVLRDRSIKDLAPYRDGRPAFGASPLDDIAEVETGEDFQFRYSPIALSNYNYVLTQVALIVDMGALTQLISRIVFDHFERYWASNYQPQIEADKACCFLVEDSRG